ncbi:transcriptional regulator [Candidatus Woesearchaeota archaeon CG10_big_fil_rev_8_21_14_0_10_44_13]|nr:MAG: transcriptional regulator [Candidatus Woesearchaeota archaeon CG10_big_fil_rev_8_21_14_0_10_44_13]
MELDLKDHQIIGLLKADSRLSVRDIAKATGIRPSTVHERIKKLVKKGIIERFTLKLNNKAIGENFIVFMLVLGKPTEYVGDTLLNNKNIKEVFGITGEYDMMFKLKFRDVEEFNNFVLNFRKLNKNVEKTLTMVVTTTLKEDI